MMGEYSTPHRSLDAAPTIRTRLRDYRTAQSMYLRACAEKEQHLAPAYQRLMLRTKEKLLKEFSNGTRTINAR